MTTDTSRRNYWKPEEEGLLKQWADKAQCYQWMHSKSHDIYSRKNALFTIPVIIISTITGTANFAQDRFSEEVRNYVVISIGTLSIIAGIISTINQFLKIAELNESHRVASLSWGKFYRNIKTELTRHPLDRTPPFEMIKFSRDEYDRLVELSPFMPVSVIKEFNSKFNKNNTIDLTKPEICDELVSIAVFKLNDKERNMLINPDSNNTDTNPKERKRKQIIKKHVDSKIEKFKETFHSLNGRFPTQEEISKNMSKFIDSVPDNLIDGSEDGYDVDAYDIDGYEYDDNSYSDDNNIELKSIGPNESANSANTRAKPQLSITDINDISDISTTDV